MAVYIEIIERRICDMDGEAAASIIPGLSSIFMGENL